MFRTILTACLILLGASMGAYAQESPDAFVKRVYDTQFPDGRDDGPSILASERRKLFFTSAVVAAMKRDEERAEAQGEMGSLDFDPISNSQDPQVKDVKVRIESQSGDRATVIANFANGGSSREEIAYDLIIQGEGWKILDIRSSVAETEWSLRGIFGMGPPKP
jgi:hypothetical protein